MKKHFWDTDLIELSARLATELARFVREELWPLMAGVSFFFILAVPLLIVMAILWYLDSIHWKPEEGRYKTGLRSDCNTLVISCASTPGPAVHGLASSEPASQPCCNTRVIV